MVRCAGCTRAIATGTTFNVGGHYGSALSLQGAESPPSECMFQEQEQSQNVIFFLYTVRSLLLKPQVAWIRVNNTTDYLISSSINNAGWQTFFNNTALNIPMSAGDYFGLNGQVRHLMPLRQFNLA